MGASFPTTRPAALEAALEASLDAPHEAQQRTLLRILAANTKSEYGRRYGFGKIKSANQFQANVPIVSYEDLTVEVERILHGEARVLTEEPVIRLHLSSGTSSASKLLPFTRGLQQEFAHAIELWMWNLRDRFPAALAGRSYWAISPNTPHMPRKRGAVPIEFDQDAAYLPSSMQSWFSGAQCVPTSVATVERQDDLLRKVALFLLNEPELTLFSFWSPSYWTALAKYILLHYDELLAELHKTAPARARAVESAGSAWTGIWPRLSLISVWTEGFAAQQLPQLRSDFPGVPIQGKGLLATEGIVTIPYSNLDADDDEAPILLPETHFYEFRSVTSGRVLLADELSLNEEYEVLITTSGGLYRYELMDRVRVAGSLRGTPRLCFCGKSGGVSDICGEKLHEDHVRRVLEHALPRFGLENAFAFLAPSFAERVPRYCLFISSERPLSERSVLAEMLEKALCENFHYSVCRNNEQLLHAEVQVVTPNAPDIYRDHKAKFSRLSTIKTRCLEAETGWESLLLS